MGDVVIRVDPENRKWWKETMTRLLPGRNVWLWDEDSFEKESIEYAVVWSPPSGMLQSLPNLRCVFSVGAGISHITDDPSFPRHIPIVRTTGHALRQRMAEYICLHVLRIHRRLPEIEAASRRAEWKWIVEPTASNVQVGIMGVGNLGAHAAGALTMLGFKVRGLSRSGRAVDGIEVFQRGQIDDFLNGCKIVISMLPGTKDTENIIDSRLLSKLQKGAWVINVGRGSQVDDEALLKALDSDHLAGAVLDVFRREPLASGHPFWNHPKILITSHTASAIEPAVGGEIIAANLLAFDAGQPIRDMVNIEQGY